MNSLIRLWNAMFGLAASLERTKELVDTANARMEQSMGLDAPALKLITDEDDAKPARKIKNAS